MSETGTSRREMDAMRAMVIVIVILMSAHVLVQWVSDTECNTRRLRAVCSTIWSACWRCWRARGSKASAIARVSSPTRPPVQRRQLPTRRAAHSGKRSHTRLATGPSVSRVPFPTDSAPGPRSSSSKGRSTRCSPNTDPRRHSLAPWHVHRTSSPPSRCSCAPLSVTHLHLQLLAIPAAVRFHLCVLSY